MQIRTARVSGHVRQGHKKTVPSKDYIGRGKACGVEDLSRILVVPACVRFIGWRGKKLISPTQVLAMSDRGAALWTEKPQPGVGTQVPHIPFGA